MKPVELNGELLRTMPLPQPKPGSKDQRGAVLVIAGSVETPGAALLAANATIRAGAGKLQIAIAQSAALHLALAVPEAMVIGLPEASDVGLDQHRALSILQPRAERADAVTIGAGMPEGEATTAIAVALCEGASSSPFVLDAAALCNLRDHASTIRRRQRGMVITPHAGEMARLLDKSREDIEGDPLGSARAASQLLGAVVVMKGAETHIVDPDGRSWLFRGGSVGLATSGSGDVLTGLVTGLLARGTEPTQAALWGVFLHGEAGRCLSERQGPLGFLARDIATEVPALMRDLALSQI